MDNADEACEWLDDRHMTIAGHCIELLRERGPLTADELGEACRAAGVTKAANPATSVSSALSWYQDGRALSIDGRWHLATTLLDGRWLTLERPSEPLAFQADRDLAPLRGTADRDGLALVDGGVLRCMYGGYWTLHDRALPEGSLLGLRMCGGAAELAEVALDSDAELRGERLAARILAARPSHSYRSAEVDRAEALLRLLAEDEQLLKKPVPPLSQLLPEPARPSWSSRPSWEEPAPYVPAGFRRLSVAVPDELYADLADAATEVGLSASELVGEELRRLAFWPRRPCRWDDEPFDPTVAPFPLDRDLGQFGDRSTRSEQGPGA